MSGFVMTPNDKCHPEQPYTVHVLGKDYLRNRNEICTVSEHLRKLKQPDRVDRTTHSA